MRTAAGRSGHRGARHPGRRHDGGTRGRRQRAPVQRRTVRHIGVRRPFPDFRRSPRPRPAAHHRLRIQGHGHRRRHQVRTGRRPGHNPPDARPHQPGAQLRRLRLRREPGARGRGPGTVHRHHPGRRRQHLLPARQLRLLHHALPPARIPRRVERRLHQRHQLQRRHARPLQLLTDGRPHLLRLPQQDHRNRP